MNTSRLMRSIADRGVVRLGRIVVSSSQGSTASAEVDGSPMTGIVVPAGLEVHPGETHLVLVDAVDAVILATGAGMGGYLPTTGGSITGDLIVAGTTTLKHTTATTLDVSGWTNLNGGAGVNGVGGLIVSGPTSLQGMTATTGAFSSTLTANTEIKVQRADGLHGGLVIKPWGDSTAAGMIIPTVGGVEQGTKRLYYQPGTGRWSVEGGLVSGGALSVSSGGLSVVSGGMTVSAGPAVLGGGMTSTTGTFSGELVGQRTIGLRADPASTAKWAVVATARVSHVQTGGQGYVIIDLPAIPSGTVGMMSIRITGYRYVAGKAFELQVGGYTYVVATNSTWIHTAVGQWSGDGAAADIPVTMLAKGTTSADSRFAIALGADGHEWSYSSLTVEVHQGFSVNTESVGPWTVHPVQASIPADWTNRVTPTHTRVADRTWSAANLVNLTGNQTIAGQKTFTGLVQVQQASGGSYVQQWRNSAGTLVASMLPTGNMYVTNVYATAPSGSSRGYFATTDSSPRWFMGASSAAETATDGVGSDFAIYRYSNAGSATGTPFTISRSTGAVTIANGLGVSAGGVYVSTGGLTVAAGTSAVQALTSKSLDISDAAGTERLMRFQTAGSTRWSMGANSIPETGSQAGSHFVFGRYNDAGAWVDNPIDISRTTGIVNIPSLYSATNITSNGTFNVSTSFSVASGVVKARFESSSANVLQAGSTAIVPSAGFSGTALGVYQGSVALGNGTAVFRVNQSGEATVGNKITLMNGTTPRADIQAISENYPIVLRPAIPAGNGGPHEMYFDVPGRRWTVKSTLVVSQQDAQTADLFQARGSAGTVLARIPVSNSLGTDIDANNSNVLLTLGEADKWFHRSALPRPGEKVDWVQNGSFGTSLTGWTAVNATWEAGSATLNLGGSIEQSILPAAGADPHTVLRGWVTMKGSGTLSVSLIADGETIPLVTGMDSEADWGGRLLEWQFPEDPVSTLVLRLTSTGTITVDDVEMGPLNLPYVGLYADEEVFGSKRFTNGMSASQVEADTLSVLGNSSLDTVTSRHIDSAAAEVGLLHIDSGRVAGYPIGQDAFRIGLSGNGQGSMATPSRAMSGEFTLPDDHDTYGLLLTWSAIYNGKTASDQWKADVRVRTAGGAFVTKVTGRAGAGLTSGQFSLSADLGYYAKGTKVGVAIDLTRELGSGTINLVTGTSAAGNYGTILAVPLRRELTVAAIPADDTVTSAPAPVKRTVTITRGKSSSKVWEKCDTTEVVRTDAGTKGYHGRYSSSRGEHKTVVWLGGTPNASVVSATGKVTFKNTHWFSGSGGTVKVRAVSAASTNTTLPTAAGTSLSVTTGYGGTATATLPTDIALGLAKGTFTGLIFYTSATQAGYGYLDTGTVSVSLTGTTTG